MTSVQGSSIKCWYVSNPYNILMHNWHSTRVLVPPEQFISLKLRKKYIKVLELHVRRGYIACERRDVVRSTRG